MTDPSRSHEPDGPELDALLVDLRSLGHDHDPVPAELIEFALLAPTIARAEADLATLVDQAEQLAGLRRDTQQLKSWEFEGGHIDVEFTDERLEGVVSSDLAPSRVRVEWTDEVELIELDDYGGFAATLRRGPCRIQLEFSDGARVTTGWTLT